MLVLTRKLNQTIIITHPNSGEPIAITVTEIRPDSVRLGVAAPPDVIVDRKEIAVQKAEFVASRTSTV